MLDEKTIKADLERLARLIVSRKFWPVLEASAHLGYTRTWMDRLIDRHGIITVERGGRKHLYAADVLEMFEESCGFKFPELRERWHREHKVLLTDSDTGQAAGQSPLEI